MQVQAAQAALKLAEARLKQTRAALTLAELTVSYAQVRAPVDGVVSRRTVEVGQMVGPERPLMAVVPQDDIWVVANFKEDQVGEMRAGQPVDGAAWTPSAATHFQGHVDSLAGASGARFALLPPDNASGNFVKVVQRIPVLIRFDGDAERAAAQARHERRRHRGHGGSRSRSPTRRRTPGRRVAHGRSATSSPAPRRASPSRPWPPR